MVCVVQVHPSAAAAPAVSVNVVPSPSVQAVQLPERGKVGTRRPVLPPLNKVVDGGSLSSVPPAKFSVLSIELDAETQRAVLAETEELTLPPSASDHTDMELDEYLPRPVRVVNPVNVASYLESSARASARSAARALVDTEALFGVRLATEAELAHEPALRRDKKQPHRFRAVEPWRRQIGDADTCANGQIETKSDPAAATALPSPSLSLEWVYGYSGLGVRNSLLCGSGGSMFYAVGSLLVHFDPTAHVQRWFVASSGITALAQNPSNHDLIACGTRSSIVGRTLVSPVVDVFNTRSGQRWRVETTLRGHVQCLSFSANGQLLAIVGNDDDNTVVLYEWASASGPRRVTAAACDPKWRYEKAPPVTPAAAAGVTPTASSTPRNASTATATGLPPQRQSHVSHIWSIVWRNSENFVTVGTRHCTFWSLARNGDLTRARAILPPPEERDEEEEEEQEEGEEGNTTSTKTITKGQEDTAASTFYWQSFYCAAYTHKGRCLVGARDGSIYVFFAGVARRAIAAHVGPVTSLQSLEGCIVSGGRDASVRFWSTAMTSLFSVQLPCGIRTLSTRDDTRRLLLATEIGEIYELANVVNLDRATASDKTRREKNDTTSTTTVKTNGASPSTTLAVPPSAAVATGTDLLPRLVVDGHSDGEIGAMACHPFGGAGASLEDAEPTFSSDDGTTTPTTPATTSASCAFQFATAGQDNQVCVWDGRTRRLLKSAVMCSEVTSPRRRDESSLTTHPAAQCGTSIAYNADGSLLCVGTQAGTLHVFEVSQMCKIAQVRSEVMAGPESPLVKPVAPVSIVAYSPDGQLLAACVGSRLHLFDCATDEYEYRLLHTLDVAHAELDRDDEEDDSQETDALPKDAESTKHDEVPTSSAKDAATPVPSPTSLASAAAVASAAHALTALDWSTDSSQIRVNTAGRQLLFFSIAVDLAPVLRVRHVRQVRRGTVDAQNDAAAGAALTPSSSWSTHSTLFSSCTRSIFDTRLHGGDGLESRTVDVARGVRAVGDAHGSVTIASCRHAKEPQDKTTTTPDTAPQQVRAHASSVKELRFHAAGTRLLSIGTGELERAVLQYRLLAASEPGAAPAQAQPS